MLVDYPESKFGGFLAVTDYKDPVILDEINANGWMLWPPIRFSYDTINKDYPRRKGADRLCLGYPAPPPWAIERAAVRCAARPARALQRARQHQLARPRRPGPRRRRARHLRLPHLAAVRPAADHAVVRDRRRGRRRAGLFRRPHRPLLPALPRDLVVDPLALRADHHLVGAGARASGRCSASLLLFEWVNLVGVVRAEFLRGRNFEYVTAARALGLSHRKIMWKHLLPNAMVATLTFLPFQLSGTIAALTALDFLGLGLPPGSPSLGELLLQGKRHLEAPWLGLTGFFSIALMLSLLIFIGEAVRDALDPRKTFR